MNTYYATFCFTINPLAIQLVQIKKVITANFHTYKGKKYPVVIIGIAFPSMQMICHLIFLK